MSGIAPGDGGGASHGSPEPPPSVEPSGLPADLLERHRAKVLYPHEAVPAAADPARRRREIHPTVYRYEYLLVPQELLHDSLFMQWFADGLKEINLRPDEWLSGSFAPPVRLEHGELPPDGPVDAWHALQRLRFRAQALPEGAQRDRFVDYMEQVSLDHLHRGTRVLRGAGGVYTGAPGTEGHHDEDGPYLSPDHSGRMPVSVVLPKPNRPNKPPNGRRVVVAVLDTGVGYHPWLSSPQQDPDPFVALLQARPISASQDPEFRYLAGLDPEGTGRLQEPLRGSLDSHAGHGTAIAGIIRQVAPQAQVLSVPIMHSDGIIYDSDLALALTMLHTRVTAAAGSGGNQADFVDVLCLAFGAYHEFQTVSVKQPIPTLLTMLYDLGIAIVASAGNDATSAPMYPASLETVYGVGALNPNWSRAIFSNEAPWLDWWALGAGVVSTLPTTFQGSGTPPLDNNSVLDANGLGRQAFDTDNFARGFGVWSGTSFAAATFASRLAAEIDEAGPSELGKITGPEAGARRDAALTAIGPAESALPAAERLVRPHPKEKS